VPKIFTPGVHQSTNHGTINFAIHLVRDCIGNQWFPIQSLTRCIAKFIVLTEVRIQFFFAISIFFGITLHIVCIQRDNKRSIVDLLLKKL
jgi:hypothetical protein